MIHSKSHKKGFVVSDAVLFLIPLLIMVLFIRVYPILEAVVKSFTSWNGLTPGHWVGLKNYIDLLRSGTFWLTFRNSMVVLISVPLQVIFGILVAVLLYEEVLGWRFFRVVFFLPQVISAVTIGFLFRVAFGFKGPIDIVLENFLHLISHPINWLGKGSTGLFVLVFVLTWYSIGWQAIVMLAGMSKIPPSIFDAAEIDGANFWQRTSRIVVPMISRTVEYGIIMSMVWTFTSIFPFIYSITWGGPGYETTTMDYLIYLKFYQSSSNLGYISALSVTLMIIISMFTLVEMHFVNKFSEWEE